MTPAQVRSRLAKRNRWCSGETALVAPLCPGWKVVDLKSKPAARLRACEECNVLAPARLRVDDSMVAMLIEATHARLQRTQQLKRAAEAAKVTTHYRYAFGLLCGAKTGQSPKGRRTHGYTYNAAGADCAECRRLLALPVEQRDAEVRAREQKKVDALAKLKDKGQKERDKDRAARLAIVEDTRAEAMTLLDALEGNGWRVPGELIEQFARVLGIAIDETKLAGNHGTDPLHTHDMLWITRRIDGASTRSKLRRVHCRFCDERLVSDVGDEEFRPSEARRYDVEFHDHTIRCALKHLAGSYLPTENPEVSRCR